MDLFDLRIWPQFQSAGGAESSPAIIDQIAIDSRRIDSSCALFVALSGQQCDGHEFVHDAAKVGAKYALVKHSWQAPQIPESLTLLRVNDPLQAFQEIAAAYRAQLGTKVIAITGSTGKTMLKDLLETMMGSTKKIGASPESFNSQIGVPLSLFMLKKEHEIALIEAAISKTGEMDNLVKMIAPDATILTQLGNKHLPTLGNLSTLASECAKMIAYPPEKQWALIPKSTLLTSHLKTFAADVHFWNEQNNELPHAFPLTTDFVNPLPYRLIFPNNDVYEGKVTSAFSYYLDLINMAVKTAWLCDISSETIIATLKNYSPESMRTEFWKSSIGATVINDVYCSDPQSVDQALRYLDQEESHRNKIFVFGGMRSKSEHLKSEYRRIGNAIQKAKLGTLYLFGQRPFEPLIDQVQKHSPQTKIFRTPHIDGALDEIKLNLKNDDLILIKGTKKYPIDKLTHTFNDSICTNQCTINLEAISSNLLTLRKKVPPSTRMMVIVKALAYGTDDTRIAKFLKTCGITILGVSYVDEGISLKRAGVTQAIFVINTAKYEVTKAVKWELELGVSEKEIITALASEAARQNKNIKVHLHIDTGMGRFGCRPEEALSLAQLIQKSPHLHLEGIMTHFACAEDPEADHFTHQQIQRFDKTIATLKENGITAPWIHASNSSATIRFPLPQYNMVRIGVATYGLSSSKSTQKEIELKPALSLLSRIVGINILNKGETLSYGRSYTAIQNNQKIAILPIGYYDGLHLNYSGKAHVLIRGKKAPMLGRICMDFMMVDISSIPNASIGDAVLIFGEDEHGHYLPPEDLARSGGSIIHELITCLGPRIQRIFIK